MATRSSKTAAESPAKQGARTKRQRRGEPGRAIVPTRSRLGTENKTHRQAKEDIVAVFLGLGGVAAMTKWAKDNKGAFYTKLYARLIPKDVSVSADAGLEDLLTQLAEKHGHEVVGDYLEVDTDA